MVFKRFFHPYHAFAQLNLIDSWWLAQADLSEPFAEALLDEFDVFLRQAHQYSPEEWGWSKAAAKKVAPIEQKLQ